MMGCKNEEGMKELDEKLSNMRFISHSEYSELLKKNCRLQEELIMKNKSICELNSLINNQEEELLYRENEV